MAEAIKSAIATGLAMIFLFAIIFVVKMLIKGVNKVKEIKHL